MFDEGLDCGQSDANHPHNNKTVQHIQTRNNPVKFLPQETNVTANMLGSSSG